MHKMFFEAVSLFSFKTHQRHQYTTTASGYTVRSCYCCFQANIALISFTKIYNNNIMIVQQHTAAFFMRTHQFLLLFLNETIYYAEHHHQKIEMAIMIMLNTTSSYYTSTSPSSRPLFLFACVDDEI